MNSPLFPDSVYEYRKKSLSSRIASSFLSMLGGLALTLLFCRCIALQLDTWSPTAAAHDCFPFPETAVLPDRESITQALLSSAFFGSDALYFDAGEENTGVDENLVVHPSDLPREDSPAAPLSPGNDEKIPDGTVADGRNIYAYDRFLLPAGELALLPYNLDSGASDGTVLLSNTTAYSPDVDAMLARDYPIPADLGAYSDEKPLILIVHTHGTEAFVPEGAVSVPAESVQRSSDITENIVSVGAVMAELLNSAGIPTIHCEIMHDLESYRNSYLYSADTVQKYLAEYPSIQYVFDVHRDAITNSSGDLIKPLTAINGELTAQVMLLVGTDEKGADHPDWDDNMTLAVKWQNQMTSSYADLARPINIRGASFNQQLRKGSLLLEIGSAANTLSEAKNAARYLTYSLITLIRENSK